MLQKMTQHDSLKFDRNHNITVATGKGTLVSRFTSRNVSLDLQIVEEIPEVSLTIIQES